MLFQILLFGPPLIVAVVLHEIAHGYVAYLLGDPTAKKLGRLSLNPIRHIDPMMTIILPGLLILMHSPVLFGGAKPVPVNPLYFKNPRRGMVLVAIAGPATNIVLSALSFGFVMAINRYGDNAPIPPILLVFFLMWGLSGVLTNLVLALFNLLPVPPLDGGRIAVGLLPTQAAIALAKLERWGLLIVFLLLSSGAISSYLDPAINFATRRLCNELFEDGRCPLLGGSPGSQENPPAEKRDGVQDGEEEKVSEESAPKERHRQQKAL